MTVRQIRPLPHTTKRTHDTVFAIGALFVLLLILRNAEFAMEGIRRGITLCMQSVIPALFPFMVITDLSASFGVGDALPHFLTSPLRKLLRLSPAGTVAILLGFLCGFPIGTKYAIRAHENGRIGDEECERVLLLSCSPSAAFLISAVGTSLWKNTRFGILLYLTTILSSLLCGTALARTAKEAPEPLPSASAPMQRTPIGTLFTGAIRSSAHGILLICAYVLFFSALGETLGTLCSALSLSHAWSTPLAMMLELSGGMSAAAESPSLFCAALCAFGSAWSGLSMHCQMLAICQNRPFSYHRFLPFKLLQGAVATLLFILLFPLMKFEF
jgi:sporulation integral membrane protein YlbJ